MFYSLSNLKADLRACANPAKAKILSRFFKTGPGDYGEGDKFLGVVVPEQRQVAKKYQSLPLSDLQKLIVSPWHEERLTALIILTFKCSRADIPKEYFDFYLKNSRYINSWDLVDLSAPKIIGCYLFNRDKKILLRLARSKNLWERRVAIISTFYFIQQGQFDWTFKIAKMLLGDKHDLVHKAVGWMLREVGKNCGIKTEKIFLDKYRADMPRTMLRYAIEKFPEKERLKYLKK
jgi:3-methyladenine DNA glycosylase AlkD